MPRLKEKRYQQQLMIAMSIYVIVLLTVWPLVNKVASVPLKWLLAISPALPVLYVIWLMARRIRDSDELEQRTHLVGLGVATGVVGVLSLVGGFLAIAKLLPIDGSILIWVFPLLIACYGITRWRVARLYSNELSCDSDNAMPTHWRLIYVAAMMAVVGIFAYFKHDAFDAGIFVGMAGGLILLALIKLVAHLRRGRATQQDEGDAR